MDEDCIPEPIEREDKFHSADYNCTNCNQTDCIYWILYNDGNSSLNLNLGSPTVNKT